MNAIIQFWRGGLSCYLVHIFTVLKMFWEALIQKDLHLLSVDHLLTFLLVPTFEFDLWEEIKGIDDSTIPMKFTAFLTNYYALLTFYHHLLFSVSSVGNFCRSHCFLHLLRGCYHDYESCATSFHPYYYAY